MSLYLDKKFIGMVSRKLDKFVVKKENLYNFRCPYCGDSSKNPNKRRGYLYYYPKGHGMQFRCHNCGKSASLGNFIKFIDPLTYRQYRMEKYKNGTQKEKVKATEEYQFDGRLGVASFLKLPSIIQLHDEHWVRQYVEYRKIPKKFWRDLFYIDDFKKLIDRLEPGNKYRLLENDARLIIPFRSPNKRGLIAIQGRALTTCSLKYITIKIQKNAPKIYGLDRVDKDKTVLITEGPIDSMFLPNCVASAGADLVEWDVPFNRRVYIFDNEPKNPQILKRMEKVIQDGANILIWPSTIHSKDINDLVVHHQKTEEDLLEIIRRNTFSGLKAKLKLSIWRKC